MKAAGISRESGRLRGDPFPTTADPDAYLGRLASEKALAQLEREILGRPGPTALTGPPGLGKTLLLRLLAGRLGGRARAVYLPYSSLPPEGLCAWALGEFGEGGEANPEASLLGIAETERARGRILLLILDDVSHLPLPTARGLVDLCAVSRGALRLLCAATDGVRTGAVVAALGPEVGEVRLSQPMNPSETFAFVRHHLDRAGLADSLRSRFDERELARLHRESGGIPRTLHFLASQLLRGGPPAILAPEPQATVISTDPAGRATDDPVGP